MATTQSPMMFVEDLSLDLVTRCKQVAAVNRRVSAIHVIEDLKELGSTLPRPLIGVMYEGARAKDGGQIGVSVEPIFSLLILSDVPAITKAVDVNPQIHGILGDLRRLIHGVRSPAGHMWRWVLEAPVSQKGGQSIWIQRWASSVQLPPGR